MRFKSDRIRAEWFGADLNGRRIHPLMKEVGTTAILFAESIGWDPKLTSILRTPEENDLLYTGDGSHRSGVHVVGRGLDISILDVDNARLQAVVRRVNEDWVYDPARPAMRCALVHGPVLHLHLQVFPATVERSYGRAAS